MEHIALAMVTLGWIAYGITIEVKEHDAPLPFLIAVIATGCVLASTFK